MLYRRDMDLKPVFRQILITLISFDCFCVIFNLLVFCFPHLSIYYYDNIFPYAVPYILPLAQIALTGKKNLKENNVMNINKNHLSSEGLYCIQINLFPFYLGSIYSTLAVAIERYMSVCHPHFTPSHCAGNFSIAGLIVFSIAFNIGRFLEFETIYRYSVSTHMHTHRYKCNYE